jgi:hypothetical protein
MLILRAGTRLPLARRRIARTMAMVSQALTHPHACEQEFSHLRASLAARRPFGKVFDLWSKHAIHGADNRGETATSFDEARL